jgi:hypothetical protein
MIERPRLRVTIPTTPHKSYDSEDSDDAASTPLLASPSTSDSSSASDMWLSPHVCRHETCAGLEYSPRLEPGEALIAPSSVVPAQIMTTTAKLTGSTSPQSLPPLQSLKIGTLASHQLEKVEHEDVSRLASKLESLIVREACIVAARDASCVAHTATSIHTADDSTSCTDAGRLQLDRPPQLLCSQALSP